MNVVEYYGSPSSNKVYEYQINHLGNLGQKKYRETSSKWWNIKTFFNNVFLPQGYPDSVSEDYLRYQIWDTVQAFCSSITSTLATQAVLKGAGVGDSTASAAGATITWLLKDGTGMVGRIAFAYLHGTSLDANAKQWRMFADVLNDCAIFVQLLAPLLPKSYFTFVMCLSGLAFSLVGVAGGCTRAALTMHQAKRNNMADVSAKDGSQETLVNLAALITSLAITPIVHGHVTTTWTLFVVFSLLHVYANYKAVSSVVMNVFNRIRFFAVADSFTSAPGHVLSPLSANEKESIFFPSDYSWLNLGCKLEDLKLTADQFNLAITRKANLKFLLKYQESSGNVSVALSRDATSEDVIRACYQSFILRRNLPHLSDDEDQFIDFLRRAGWDLNIQQLRPDEWRWCSEDSIDFTNKAIDKHV